MKKRIRTPIELEKASSEYDFLQCPKCNENYLHQHSVLEYVRKGEDGPTLAMELCDLGAKIVTHENVENRNPSSRRHGMRVTFYCEHCTPADENGWTSRPEIELVIAQHKGFTEIWMEHDSDEDE